MVINLLHAAYNWQDRYYQLSDETIFNISKTYPECPDNCCYYVSEIASPDDYQGPSSNPRVLGICAPYLHYQILKFEGNGARPLGVQKFWLQHLTEEGDKIHIVNSLLDEDGANVCAPKAVFKQRHPEESVFGNSYYEKWLRMDVCNHVIPMVNAGQTAAQIWEKLPLWLKRPESANDEIIVYTVTDKRGRRLKESDMNRLLKGEAGLEFEYCMSYAELANNTWNLNVGDLVIENGLYFADYNCVTRNGIDYAQTIHTKAGFTYDEFYYNIFLPIKRGEITSLASTWLYDQGLKPNADALDVINSDTAIVQLEPSELAEGKPKQYVLAPIVEPVGEPEEQTINVINENGEVEEQTIMLQKSKTSIVIGDPKVTDHHADGFVLKEVDLTQLTPSEPFNP